MRASIARAPFVVDPFSSVVPGRPRENETRLRNAVLVEAPSEAVVRESPLPLLSNPDPSRRQQDHALYEKAPMEDEAPNPEGMCRGDGDEKKIIVNKGVKPIDATDKRIQGKVEKDITEKDRGPRHCLTHTRHTSDHQHRAPKQQVKKREMRPVVVLRQNPYH